MKQIFDSVIKRKVIDLILDLADGFEELIIDITLSFETFNSIEVSENSILLHTFNDDLEFTTDFDDLDDDDKIDIYHQLFCFL